MSLQAILLLIHVSLFKIFGSGTQIFYLPNPNYESTNIPTFPLFQ